jgi:hypothetical protein
MSGDIFRDNNLTKYQKKGIDIVIKSVNKKYPFIKGWDFYPKWKNYTANLYINLYVDFKGISEFYNIPIHPYYINYTDSIDVSFGKQLSLFSHLKPSKSDFISMHKESKVIQDKIESTMNDLMGSLPEEFRVFYTFNSDEYSSHLSIGEFVDYRDQQSPDSK